MTSLTYLEEAENLCLAVKTLCEARRGETLYAIGILASHCLELALKAYLLHIGQKEKELKKIGHDINHAWNECVKSGLPLEELPYWVQVLSYSYANPYFFRYPRGDHNVAVPNTDELPNDIEAVLHSIKTAMRR